MAIKPVNSKAVELNRFEFGNLLNGEVVEYFRVENEFLELCISNYGCRLLSLIYKPLSQQLVMGQWSLPEYEADVTYSGAVIGRTTNRLSNAQFEIAGILYQLESNEPPHQLHGGFDGFHNRCWQATMTQNGIILKTVSEHGEGGYPGTVEATVHISLIDNQLVYKFTACSDRPTYVDMTNHTYFCLDNSGSILDHQLILCASQFIPVDDKLIPTGEILPCEGSPFDFRQGKTVGHDLDIDNPQLKIGGGFDHSFVLGKRNGFSAELYSPLSQIVMMVETDAPALQLYTGNYLPSPYSALCLETQHLPNACNQAGFAEPLVTPDQPYSSQTSYGFAVKA